MASLDTCSGPRGAEVSVRGKGGAVVPPVLPSLPHAATSSVWQTNSTLISPSKYTNLATLSSRVAVKSKPRGSISVTAVILVYSILSLSSVKCNSREEDGEKAGGFRLFHPKDEFW